MATDLRTNHIAADPMPRMIRLCGYASLLIPVVAIPGMALLVFVSDVDIPRNHATTYLADLSSSGIPTGLAPWLLGAIPVLSVFLWLGVFWALREENRPLTLMASAFGLVAAAVQTLLAIFAAVLVGSVAPAWAGATDAAIRAAVELDFQVVQWGFDAAAAAFDTMLFFAQIVAAIVMLTVHRRVWTVAAWLGILSGIGNIIGVAAFAAESLQPFATIGFFIGMGWAAAVGVGLLRQSRHASVV